MNSISKKPRAKFRKLTPLDKAVRNLREQCWLETNEIRILRMEKKLEIVSKFKEIKNPTVEQQNEYYKAARILFQAGIC